MPRAPPREKPRKANPKAKKSQGAASKKAKVEGPESQGRGAQKAKKSQ
jgi:hypothetical protein